MKKIRFLSLLLALLALSNYVGGQGLWKKEFENGKWGFVDKTNKVVIPGKYDDAGSFTEELAPVKLDGKWGFIDKTGKEVISVKYDEVGLWFSGGFVSVKLNAKWGIIDNKGTVIIPTMYVTSDEAFSKRTEQLAKNRVDEKNIPAVVQSDIDINIPVNAGSNEKTFAVIIANENYQREAKVIFAKNDGETFKKYCIQTLGLPEKNVHFVADATLNNFRGEINWLSGIANAFDGEASVIFYYAGHGIPDESTKTAYLLPVDGYGSDVETGYKLDNLYAKLGALRVKSISIFMDACFSGAQRSGDMMASARGVAIKTVQGKPLGNMVVFSAAQGDETAHPYREKGHGLFTYFLLKKLQETKGNVTLGELSDYITTQVKRQSIVVNNKSQTPSVTASETLRNNWQEIKLK